MSLIYAPPGSVGPSDLISDDTQIQWDGLLMGVDTFFGYKQLIGWDDLPGVDLTDAPRPRANGDFPGSMFGQGRIVSFDTQIWGVNKDDGSFAELRREFLRRTQIEQVEKPLTIRQHGETMMMWAKVIGRTWPINRGYFNGYPVASIQWKATDPNKYSIAEEHITLHVPSSSGGLDWTTGGGLNWAPGLDWGTVVTGSSAIVNTGLSESPVRLEFHGPLSAPYFVNSPGNWAVGFTLPLALGETLIADARTGTVTLGGIDRYYTLAPLSDLIEDALAPEGSTPVQFVPGNPGDTGSVDLYWRDALM